MYTPKDFEVNNPVFLNAAMQDGGLATLITMTPRGLIATHLPILVDEDRGPHGTLVGHVSRANTQWRDSDPDVDALIIFSGPDTYVTPTWYPAKQEHGRVVPTWNYAAVHAYGRLAFFEDTERLRDVVTRLTIKFEATFAKPWQVSDAPANYIDGQLKAIVGFEMPINRIEGKLKFSQNRSAADRAGVRAGLRELGDQRKTEVAVLMDDIESRLQK